MREGLLKCFFLPGKIKHVPYIEGKTAFSNYYYAAVFYQENRTMGCLVFLINFKKAR